MKVAQPICPRCGSPGAPRAISAGLCPACLIEAALAQDDEPCPYRVLAPMSEDAGGITYLAQALSGAHGYVALKVHDRADGGAVLDRYRRWKPKLDALQHPNVARFIDAGVTTEGLVYVASEYVTGSPIRAVVAGVATDAVTRNAMARQIAEAIAAVHALGLAHMQLDTSHIRISMVNGPHATILGTGKALVVNGLEPHPDTDLASLARVVRELNSGESL